MIGLDFVKHVDKDWKKHLTYIDGSSYYDDYCPLGKCKCRREDCTFWNSDEENCRYYIKTETKNVISNEDNNIVNKSLADNADSTVEERVDEILAKIEKRENI